MRNWTIGRRLALGFGLATVITTALGVFAGTRLLAVDAWSQKITQDALPGVTSAHAKRALHNRVRSQLED